MAVDDLEALEETLAVLRDEEAMQDLARAETEVAAGDTLDADGLRDQMGKRSPRT